MDEIITLDLDPLMDLLKSIYGQMCIQTKELIEIKEELRLKAQIIEEKKL